MSSGVHSVRAAIAMTSSCIDQTQLSQIFIVLKHTNMFIRHITIVS